MKNPGKETDAQKLRKAAEAKAEQNRSLKPKNTLSEAEAARLIHELEVHQIELEMQNEKLLHSKNMLQTEVHKYTELYDLYPMGYFTLSFSGKIMEVNQSGVKMLDKNMSVLTNRLFEKYIAPGDIPVFRQFIEYVFSNNGSQKCEIELLMDKKRRKFVMLHGIAIAGKEQCLITAMDITQQHLAYEALRESEEKYKTITDSTTDIIYIIDKTGKQLYFNKQIEHILGYKREELIGQNFSKYVPKSELPKYLTRLSNIFFRKEVKHFKTRIYHKDGHLVDVEINGKLIRQNGKLVGEGTIKDITETRKAEEALRKSEERFSLAMDAANDGLWDWDVATGKIYFSPGCYRMLGYEPNDFESTWDNWKKPIHPDDLEYVLKNIRNYRKSNGHGKPIEFRAKAKDGSWHWLMSRGRVVERDSKGVALRVIGTHIDITERKHAEEVMRQGRERSLRQRNALSRLMLDGVLIHGDYKSSFNQLTREVAKALQVDYVSIWLLNNQGNALTCMSQYLFNLDKYVSCQPLKRVNYQNYFKTISTKGKLFSDDAQNDPRFKEFLQPFLTPHRIHSILDTGIFVEGRFEGLVCIAHANSKRLWHNDEEAFAGAVAAVVAQTLANIRSKQANDALLEERQRLSDVVKGTNAGTWVWNIQTNETVFNERWAEILGYTLAEISPTSNQTWNNYSHPDDLKKADELLEKHLSGELDYHDCQVRMKHKDGRWIWTLHRGKVISRAEDGKPLMMSGTHQDINEHKMAEEALKASEHRARALLDATPDLMFRINSKGDILDYKPAIDCNFPSGDIIGKNLSNVIPPQMAELIRCRFVEIIETGKMRVDEYHFTLPTMGEVNFEARTVRGSNDEVIAIVRDISERKKAETEINRQNQELQKLNATKDKFFSIIAHDLKSPFNSIVGFSELLVEKVKENDLESIEKYAEIIQKSSYRAMELLTNLMEWSRSQTARIAFEPELCNLYQLIHDTIDILSEIARQKSIVISNDVQAGTLVYADMEMIATILRNLIANAIKFTSSGGWIKISARKYNHETIVSVHDNGVGIAEANIEKLFRIDENYTTTGTDDEQGTGLGLILCKEFIEKHGGRIWVESQVGRGSVFSFSLPVLTAFPSTAFTPR